LQIRGAQLQGTLSNLVVRNPLSRLKETLTTVELLLKNKLNNFEIRIPSYYIDDKQLNNAIELINCTDLIKSNKDLTKLKEIANLTLKVNYNLKLRL
jgi:hypothetical protein